MSAVARAETQGGALLGCYQSIERASRDMLSAARDSDWDRVGEIQQHCGALIDQARRLGGGASLSRSDQQIKMRIVRQIVLNEAQIRQLANPWTERFERMVFGSPAAANGGRHAS